MLCKIRGLELHGYANFCLNWKALQSTEKDYKRANYIREEVLNCYANLRFSSEIFV
jgi:hypothetical protein